MAYNIKYLDKEGGVIVTYSGIVTDEDIENSLTERLSNLSRVKSFKYAVTDCTCIEKYEVSTEGMIRAAETASQFEGVNDDIVAVCIMPKDLEFGMARLWEGHVSHKNWNVRIVRSWQQAEDYLVDNLE